MTMPSIHPYELKVRVAFNEVRVHPMGCARGAAIIAARRGLEISRDMKRIAEPFRYERDANGVTFYQLRGWDGRRLHPLDAVPATLRGARFEARLERWRDGQSVFPRVPTVAI